MRLQRPMPMRIEGEWINAPETQAVCAMLTGAGYQALFVGGCVRNALLQAPVADIDISTDALPDEVMRLAQAAGLKAVPTGIEHGTVTVVSGSIPHEVTTFRRDVESHGRHATVAFSTDVTEDARRRDFTMNALYADATGRVIDPLGGLEDLVARKVRFIEEPAARIKEDYLRILRFFRFFAWYGDPENGIDPEGLAACAAHTDGLARLSRERVGSELLKLLAAKTPVQSVASMRQAGVLMTVLEGADDKALGPLVHFETEWHLPPDPIRRLAALGGENLQEALRLSKVQARRLDKLRGAIGSGQGLGELAYREDAAFALDAALLRSAIFELPAPENASEDIAKGAEAVFPISAEDLDGLTGRALGDRLKALEYQWIASGFTATRDALLEG